MPNNIYEQLNLEPPKQLNNSDGEPNIYDQLKLSPPDISHVNQNALGGESNPEYLSKEESNSKALYNLGKQLFSPQEFQQLTEGEPVDLWESIKGTDSSVIPAATVIPTIVNTGFLFSAVKKLDDGGSLEDLSLNELDAFKDSLKDDLLNSTRGTTLGSKIYKMASHTPAFAFELGATGGAALAAKKGAEKVVGKVVKNQIAKRAAGIVAAGAASIALIPNDMNILVAAPASYVRSRIGVTEKGEVVIGDGETPATSVIKAAGTVAIEVGTEMAGAGIGRYIYKPIGKVLNKVVGKPIAAAATKFKLKTPLITAAQKLPLSFRLSVVNASKKLRPRASVVNTFSRFHLNSVAEELGEEQLGRMLSSALGLTDTDDDTPPSFTKYMASIVPSPEQFLVELGAISIYGSVRASSSIAFNILTKEKNISPDRATRIVNTMSVYEQEAFVDENLNNPAVTVAVDDAPKFMRGGDLDTLINNKGFAFKKPRKVKNRGKNSVAEISPPVNVAPLSNISSGVIVSKIESQHLANEIPQPIPTQESGVAREFEKFKKDKKSKKDEDVIPLKDTRKVSIGRRLFLNWIDQDLPVKELTEKARKLGVEVPSVKDLDNLMSTRVIVQDRLGIFVRSQTSKLMPDGSMQITGVGLAPIIDDFDAEIVAHEPNGEIRTKELQQFLIAKHFLEDLAGRDNILTTDKQLADSRNTLEQLEEKYGDNFAMFEHTASEIYGYLDRIRELAFSSGLISKEQYEREKELNKYYVPFFRVLEEIEDSINSTAGNNIGFQNKALKGSKLDVDPNVIANIIGITESTLRAATHNDIRNSIRDMKDVLPEYVKDFVPKNVPVGVARFKVVFDKKLRSKLRQLAASFNVGFTDKMPKGAKGLILGSYSHQEQLVRLRLGATDSVLAHEVGHMLDFKLGLKENLLENNEQSEKIKKELLKLADDRLDTEITFDNESTAEFEEIKTDIESSKHKDYLRNDRELLANLFDAYVTAPELLEKTAPTAKAELEKILKKSKAWKLIKNTKPSVEKGVEEIAQTVFAPSKIIPKDVFISKKNGKTVLTQATSEIMDVLNKPASIEADVFMRFFTASASLLRFGIIAPPSFWIQNMFGDTQVSAIQTGGKYNSTKLTAALFDVVLSVPARVPLLQKVAPETSKRKKQERKLLGERAADSGGLMSTLHALTVRKKDGEIELDINKLLGRKTLKQKVFKNHLETAALGMENFTRKNVFKALKDVGLSDIDAAVGSRKSSIDFNRGGSASKWVNNMLPFFNATLQGTDAVFRAIKNNPKAVVVAALVSQTIPAIMYTSYMLGIAPDDEREEWLSFPDSVRNRYWLMKVGGNWVKIRKAWLWSALFASSAENAMVAMYEQDPETTKRLAKNWAFDTLNSLTPVNTQNLSTLVPPIIKTSLETAANFNLYFESNISPEWKEGLDPEERYNRGTTEAAKSLGAIFNTSPAKIEHAIRGLSGTAGKSSLDVTDNVIKYWHKFIKEDYVEQPSGVLPIIGVKKPVGSHSIQVQTLYDHLKQARQTHRTLNLKEKRGDEDIEKYIAEHSLDIEVYDMLKDTAKEFHTMLIEQDEIKADNSLTRQQKKQRMDAIGLEMRLLAQEINNEYTERAKESEDK